jgi:RsiW-degrading membrane proteinase PrsW (M82 family)
MAAMFLGLVCGPLAVVHGINSLRGRRSRPVGLPPVVGLVIPFALVLGLGNVVLNFHASEEYLFPPLFLLGAALPTLVVLSWAGRRLGWPATWRQSALSLVSGSTLSILVTILLGSVLPVLVYVLIRPLEELLWDLPLLLTSPELLSYILFVALQAPIPEEFAKALGPGLFGRRISSERQAFFVGLASGAGFAILENMLYQGLYAQWSGWTWGGVTLLRAFGSVLHPLGTAIIARALFRARGRPPGWFGQLARAYLLSVGLHTLWNGGFELLTYFAGISYGTGRDLNFYGEAISVALVAFLLLLSAGLWWLMIRIVRDLTRDEVTERIGAEPHTLVSPRALAAWALACALVVVPIGAALGPAWRDIRSILLGTV